MTDYADEKTARFANAFPARAPDMVAKHRARAVECLASHRCSTDLTDGFCGPRDGKCQHHKFSRDGYRNCHTQAESLMQAIESRGCTVVWAFDQNMRGES